MRESNFHNKGQLVVHFARGMDNQADGRFDRLIADDPALLVIDLPAIAFGKVEFLKQDFLNARQFGLLTRDLVRVRARLMAIPALRSVIKDAAARPG